MEESGGLQSLESQSNTTSKLNNNNKGTVLSTYISSHWVIIATNKAGDIFASNHVQLPQLVFTVFYTTSPQVHATSQMIPKALATQPGCRHHLGVTPQLPSLYRDHFGEVFHVVPWTVPRVKELPLFTETSSGMPIPVFLTLLSVVAFLVNYLHLNLHLGHCL